MTVALLNCQMSNTPGQPIGIALVGAENRKVLKVRGVVRNSSNATSLADFSLNYQVTIVIVILVVDRHIDS
jgi:hypothetical protein